jgi:meso-butanediol dehydrogenase/(S,S)-butanediol dehydrogenase/diacetyl reductase
MPSSKQVVVVLGATGVVGSGAVKRYLGEGATVVAVSRSAQKLEALKTRLAAPQLLTAVGDFTSDEQALETRDAVSKALGGQSVDHVLSSIGFVTVDQVATATSLKTFQGALDGGLFNNFLAARAFLPALKTREASSFTMVSGGLAHFPPPDPKLWMGTVKNAAVNALTFGLASETLKDKVRVNTVCIHFSVAMPGEKKNHFGMPAEKDTDALAPIFPAVARGLGRGQVICLNNWTDVERIAQ